MKKFFLSGQKRDHEKIKLKRSFFFELPSEQNGRFKEKRNKKTEMKRKKKRKTKKQKKKEVLQIFFLR